MTIELKLDAASDILTDQVKTYKNEDFSGHDFSEDELKNPIFDGCKLKNVNFSGLETLEGALFINCDLIKANFAETNLIGALFSGCDLYGSDFTGSCLSFARFVKNRMAYINFHATLMQETKIFDCYSPNAFFSDSICTQMVVRNTKLETSLLINTDLTQSVFIDSTLSHCVFQKAIVDKTVFINTNLTFTDFANSTIKDVFTDNFFQKRSNLREIFLSQSRK
jgi:uncharacterized protein YjbI with pentapeptide repeats